MSCRQGKSSGDCGSVENQHTSRFPGDRSHLAGMRRSSIVSRCSLSNFKPVLVFFDWTLTTTFAGLRSPARTSSDKASASVMVALNRPVLRCFGRWVSIRVRTFWKPRSRRLDRFAVEKKDTLVFTGRRTDLLHQELKSRAL